MPCGFDIARSRDELCSLTEQSVLHPGHFDFGHAGRGWQPL